MKKQDVTYLRYINRTTLYNVIGEIIHEEIPAGTKSVTLDLSKHKQGVYFLRINDHMVKVIKF